MICGLERVNQLLKYSTNQLTSMCNQTECFSQTLAISLIGSNAPKTVVPAVAITTSGHIPCEGRREKRKRRRRKEGGMREEGE